MRLEEVTPKMERCAISKLEKEPFFRPAYDFYRENLERLLSELDWHLQHSWLVEPLTDCQELQLLKQAVISCDERLLTDVPHLKDLVLKISPNHSYSKVLTNYSKELFWGRKFTENILIDVRNKALPVSVAASGLGVTSEMIYFAINKDIYAPPSDKFDQDNPTEVIAVADYWSLGYGTREEFWWEQSIVDLLQDVRNRNISVEKVAALTGVSRNEVLGRCGGVKDEKEVEAERKIERFAAEQKKLQESLIVKQKKSPLEIQIEMAENNIGNLSDYEKMRLKNMKERFALLKSLNMDKEKNEMNILRPQKKSHKVKEVVELRGKSARVKRRSQVLNLKTEIKEEGYTNYEWILLQESRKSPKYFGHWVPRTNKYLDAYKRAWRMAVTDIDKADKYDEK